MAQALLLRLDRAVRNALASWARDELRSVNAQIEFLLRRALSDSGRLPDQAEGQGEGRGEEQESAGPAGPG